jgi:hypothetical protein
MISPDLHIVTFAVPYPANYGGAIDVWNRLVTLKSAGLRIHLHCFVYGPFTPQAKLDEVAEKVYYYPRVVKPVLFSRGQPYIVTSRKSKALLNNLLADKSPILFEGIHTTGFAKECKGRKLLLRAHNVEHQYYAELANQTRGIKSLIFRRESLCLQDAELDLSAIFDVVLAISPKDKEWFESHGTNTILVPPFHGLKETQTKTGRGQYILYQGDLSIEINQEAVLDMMQRIPPDAAYPVVVAGRSGDRGFEEKLARYPNIKREADVSGEKMIELIENAQVILVHSLHGSGMKLKIFPALFHGRFVAATMDSQTNTPLDKAIHFYPPSGLAQLLETLWPTPFSTHHLLERKEILALQPGDAEKAREILRYL